MASTQDPQYGTAASGCDQACGVGGVRSKAPVTPICPKTPCQAVPSGTVGQFWGGAGVLGRTREGEFRCSGEQPGAVVKLMGDYARRHSVVSLFWGRILCPLSTSGARRAKPFWAPANSGPSRPSSREARLPTSPVPLSLSLSLCLSLFRLPASQPASPAWHCYRRHHMGLPSLLSWRLAADGHSVFHLLGLPWPRPPSWPFPARKTDAASCHARNRQVFPVTRRRAPRNGREPTVFSRRVS